MRHEENLARRLDKERMEPTPGGAQPIFQAVEHVSACVEGVAQVIDRMTHKLHPILGPEYSDPPTEKDGNSREVSDLANTLENQAKTLERLIYSANRTIDRIEL